MASHCIPHINDISSIMKIIDLINQNIRYDRYKPFSNHIIDKMTCEVFHFCGVRGDEAMLGER